MSEDIRIIEKPDWVSWEEIHQVLVKAHAENRKRGINMRKPSLPGDEIKIELGEAGVMLVALDGKRVVGTAALIPKSSSTWYNEGPYGYMCFASILPEYIGKGLYKALCLEREALARNLGLTKLYIDTHQENQSVIDINTKNGFKIVGIKVCKDHDNLVLFKWLDGCPYSDNKCRWEYSKQKWLLKIKRTIKAICKIK